VDLSQCAQLAQQFRVDVIRATAAAGSGHPTSALSAADLLAVLAGTRLRYDFDDPFDRRNDRLILSKGHAAPLLYALYRSAGLISDKDLLSYRQLGSRLGGHPTARLPWVEAATGSLGQGLPIGTGMALAAGELAGTDAHVWVLCGDAELDEGSNWEAIDFAGWRHLGNLTLIVDVNGSGASGRTRHGWDTEPLTKKLKAFGWHPMDIDGHSLDQIDKAYAEAMTGAGPTAILARTKKGSGVAALEGLDGFHSKLVPDHEAAVEQLGGRTDLRVILKEPVGPPAEHRMPRSMRPPAYRLGEAVPVRQAYGDTMVRLAAADPELVVLDAQVGGATRADTFARACSDRYVDFGIAEQLMCGSAVGMQRLGYTVFAATFAAFWTRAHDFVRMAAAGHANLHLVGSHPGVSIGPDGVSQMGLEDIAMFRAVHGSVVLYPSDANQAAKLLVLMAGIAGISYLRLTRAALPVIYSPHRQFRVGGSEVLRRSERDDLTIVSAGITLHQAFGAADLLAETGIRARVIDLYSIQPIDVQTLVDAANETGRILTVEDHRRQGGLGEAVLSALAEAEVHPQVGSLAITSIPGSGSEADQLRVAGLNAKGIVRAAQLLL
jgi:transketolase